MKNTRKAISAIIGTAIALTIVFAVIIPLFIYMQSLQSLFMQEANRRLQYELERLNEKLEVYTTICGGWGTAEIELCAVVFNPGILSVSIPMIYVESYRYGLIVEEKFLHIFPGERKIINLEKIAFNPAVDDTVRVKFITLRGNSFTSKNIIGPRNLPYTLVVIIKNMTLGYRYQVKAEVVGEYGCVSTDIDQMCQAFAEHILIPQRTIVGENATIGDATLAFMVAPGNYTVSLSIYKSQTGELVSFYRILPVEVLGNMVVWLDASHQVLPLEQLPLRIRSPLPNNTVVVMHGDTETINIPYTVSLGNKSEPLRNIAIQLGVSSSGLSITQIYPSIQNVSRIIPGETYSGFFQVTIQDDDNGNATRFGGSILYQILLQSAEGELSHHSYTTTSIENPVVSGKLVACRYGEIVVENQTLPLLICETSSD